MSLDHLTERRRLPGRPPIVRRPTGRITAETLHQGRRGLAIMCLLESAPPEVLDAWRRILGVLERRARRRAANR